MLTEWGRITTLKVRRRSLERRLRRGRMRGRGGVAGGRGSRRTVRTWRREVLWLTPPKCLSLLVGIEGPVLGDVVPNIPAQMVRVIFHAWDLFDQREQLFLFFFPESICKKNKRLLLNILHIVVVSNLVDKMCVKLPKSGPSAAHCVRQPNLFF